MAVKNAIIFSAVAYSIFKALASLSDPPFVIMETSMAIMPIQKYIRISDAVERYSLSRSTFYRAIKSGEITPIKKGRAVLLEIEALDRWINSEAA